MDESWKPETYLPISKIEDGCYDSTRCNSNDVNYLDLDSLKQSEQKASSTWNYNTDRRMENWSDSLQGTLYNYPSGVGQYPVQQSDNLWTPDWSFNIADSSYVHPTMNIDMSANSMQLYREYNLFGGPNQNFIIPDRELNMPTWPIESNIENTTNYLSTINSEHANQYSQNYYTTSNLKQNNHSSVEYNSNSNNDFQNPSLRSESNVPVCMMNQSEVETSRKYNGKKISESKEENIMWRCMEERKGKKNYDDDVVVLNHMTSKQKEGSISSILKNNVTKGSPLKFKVYRSHQGVLTLTQCDQKVGSPTNNAPIGIKRTENGNKIYSPYKYRSNTTVNEGHLVSNFDHSSNDNNGINQMLNQFPYSHINASNKDSHLFQCNNHKLLTSNLVKIKDDSYVFNDCSRGTQLKATKSVTVPKEFTLGNSVSDFKTPALKYSGLQRIPNSKSISNEFQTKLPYKCIKILSKDKAFIHKDQGMAISPTKFTSAPQQFEGNLKMLPHNIRNKSILQSQAATESSVTHKLEDKSSFHNHNNRRSVVQTVKIISKDGHQIAKYEPALLRPTKYISKLKRENEIRMHPINGYTNAVHFGLKKQSCLKKFVNVDGRTTMNKDNTSVYHNGHVVQDSLEKSHSEEGTIDTNNGKHTEHCVGTKQHMEKCSTILHSDVKTIDKVIHGEETIKTEDLYHHGNKNTKNKATTIPGETKDSEAQVVTLTLMENNIVGMETNFKKHASVLIPKIDPTTITQGKKTPLRIIIKKRQEESELLENNVRVPQSNVTLNENQEKSPFSLEAEKNLTSEPEATAPLQHDSEPEEAQLPKTKSFVGPRKKLVFRCNKCGQRQATRNSLITHIKSHQQPFCKLCLVVVNTMQQLQNHMIRGHPVKSALMFQQNLQFVTSKYGRRRPVFSTSSLTFQRKKREDTETKCEKIDASKGMRITRKRDKKKIKMYKSK